jgi:hypothetical protein
MAASHHQKALLTRQHQRDAKQSCVASQTQANDRIAASLGWSPKQAKPSVTGDARCAFRNQSRAQAAARRDKANDSASPLVTAIPRRTRGLGHGGPREQTLVFRPFTTRPCRLSARSGNVTR